MNLDPGLEHRRLEKIANQIGGAELVSLAAHTNADQPTSRNSGRIAIIAHVYYDDLWPELAEAIKRCPVDFDLFVTLAPHNALTLPRIIRRAFPQAQILSAPNRGRDLGPFTKAVLAAERVADYMAICKIHSKKGITEPETWRFLLLDSVLGSAELIRQIVSAFETDPQLALVGAKELYVSGPKFISVNRRNLTTIARAVYPDREMPRQWGFIAGTMFWFRPKVFERFVRYLAERVTFNDDISANDGQIAHAIERFIGLIPTVSGQHIGLVTRTDDARQPHHLQVVPAPGTPGLTPPTEILRRATALRRPRGALTFS